MNLLQLLTVALAHCGASHTPFSAPHHSLTSEEITARPPATPPLLVRLQPTAIAPTVARPTGAWGTTHSMLSDDAALEAYLDEIERGDFAALPSRSFMSSLRYQRAKSRATDDRSMLPSLLATSNLEPEEYALFSANLKNSIHDSRNSTECWVDATRRDIYETVHAAATKPLPLSLESRSEATFGLSSEKERQDICSHPTQRIMYFWTVYTSITTVVELIGATRKYPQNATSKLPSYALLQERFGPLEIVPFNSFFNEVYERFTPQQIAVLQSTIGFRLADGLLELIAAPN